MIYQSIVIITPRLCAILAIYIFYTLWWRLSFTSTSVSRACVM